MPPRRASQASIALNMQVSLGGVHLRASATFDLGREPLADRFKLRAAHEWRGLHERPRFEQPAHLEQVADSLNRHALGHKIPT